MKKALKACGIILLIIIVLGCIGFPTGSNDDQQAASEQSESTDENVVAQPTKTVETTSTPTPTASPAENSETDKDESVQEETNQKDSVKVYASATTKVKIREEANTDCNVLGLLETGDTVEILDGKGDDWCHVKYNEIEGYVKSEYLTEKTVGLDANDTLNSDWKKDLPFKYDDKYTTSQNLYIYLTENSITPPELQKVIDNSDLTGTVKPTRWEEDDSVHYDRQKVSIKDESGELNFELNKWDSGWKCDALDYKVTGAHGMGIMRRTPENGHTYYITDLDHPLNNRMGVTSFDTLREALKCIQDNYM